ncbi:type VII secretion protein EssC [Streptococcus intermedius]|uniref:type VII secretion protein EssC n=1 Tax=Streptococcus intermedius TaxID=1338 RepID=UPI003BAC8CD9
MGDNLVTDDSNQVQIILFGEKLSILTLSEGEIVSEQEFTFQMTNSEVYVNGKELAKGTNTVDNELIFVLETKTIYAKYLFPPSKDFIISNGREADLSIQANAYVLFAENKVYLYPNGSLLYINNQLVSSDVVRPFNVGDCIFVENYFIERRENQWQVFSLFKEPIFNKKSVLIENKKNIYQSDFPNYRRSPRIIPIIYSEKQKIEKPQNPPTKPKNAIWRAIIPPLGMIALSGLVAILVRRNAIMMLTMGGMSVLTATFSVTGYFSDKKEYKQKKLMRVEDYEAYLLKQVSILHKHFEEEKNILFYRQPSVHDLMEMIVHYDDRLYERLPFNEDFMVVSLGLGDIDSCLQIDYQTNYLTKDDITIFSQDLLKNYKKQKEVPVTTNLAGNVVGLVVSHNTGQLFIQQLLLQIAAFHSYHDVIFVNLISQEDYNQIWKKWRFLPHFQLPSINVRSFVYDERSKDVVLTSLYQVLQSRFQEKNGRDKTYLPQIVIIISDDHLLSGHAINEFLSRPDLASIGVTVIWSKESRRQLPETITTLISIKNSNTATLINNQGKYINQTFKPYPVLDDYEMVVRSLSNLNHEESQQNSLPDAITFLEMYNVEQVDELNISSRWACGDASKSLAVPLGVRGKDDIVYLNLHERAHGPHGLVAGTTGSGKSEILQSYILSLSLNFSPEDIGFLPIDFKGGGMANLFKSLPHLMGVITNLDGAGTQRALASIRAELQKRQRLFGQFGVNHINGYTRLYKKGRAGEKGHFPTEPLPHLFLISDEFAELKQNEPEFMTELVSTARIGRSLGIHLILATQKPSGVVNDQIWSNSRFKLALKVAEAADSNEIIKTPDAASITQPGRAYLQVGNNEIYELFQSAWSGANYSSVSKLHSEEIDNRLWKINELGQYELITEDLSYMDEEDTSSSEKTELEAVVEYIAQYAKSIDLRMPKKPWLLPLRENIISPILSTKWTQAKQYKAPFALMDIPSEQSQRVLDFDLEEFGHSLIYGSPGFGKSQALQTLVMNFARINRPDQMHFNLFDFGTNGLFPLKDLPHVADIATLDDSDKLLKVLKHLRKELQRRRELLAEYGVTSIEQYEQKTGSSLPIIVNVIDSYDTVREHPLEGQIEPTFYQILREGDGLGIYLITTVLRNTTLKLNMRSNFATQFVLYLIDKDSKKEIIGFDALTDQVIPGRGQIRFEEPIRFQVYLAAEGDSDLERLQYLENNIASMNESWDGERPQAVPMLANEITFDDFENDAAVQEERKNFKIPIGYDKETTKVRSVEPMAYEFILLMGDTPSQIYSIEQTLLSAFNAFDGKIERVVVDIDGRFAGMQEYFDTIVEEINVLQFFRELLGLTQSAKRRKKPMFVYLPDINLTGDKIVLTDKDLNTIFTKASSVNIHLIFHGYQNGIESKFTPFFKRLRQNVPMGTFGTIFNDQKVVPGRNQFNEPLVGINETQFFVGRNVSRLKLPQDK